ncbi:MAG: protein-L-isoaspartate(D-aspartate) O-methyltransferase [Gammaproteobacteria bacterium]|nr:protein-L-isoaspartate(D-aspartate) O-methyltransferase [Gammaproteobacteria bacterium]
MSGTEFARERRRLLREVEEDMRACAAATGRDTLSPRVAAALEAVPRHRFVPHGMESLAYANRPLDIGLGQTISQPFIVALMTELLDLQPGDTVLEIGTGSGYQAAVLARLVERVYSVEVLLELARTAQRHLQESGSDNVALRIGDGRLGWPEHAPYDAVIVTAAAPEIPGALLDQLKTGGRLIAPLGLRHAAQELVLFTKDANGGIHRRIILPVAFVPLVEPGAAETATPGH